MLYSLFVMFDTEEEWRAEQEKITKWALETPWVLGWIADEINWLCTAPKKEIGNWLLSEAGKILCMFVMYELLFNPLHFSHSWIEGRYQIWQGWVMVGNSIESMTITADIGGIPNYGQPIPYCVAHIGGNFIYLPFMAWPPSPYGDILNNTMQVTYCGYQYGRKAK